MSTASLDAIQLQQIEGILRALDERPAGAAANRRGGKRMVVRMSLPVMLLGQAGMPSVPMHTRNISTSGIGFLSKRVFKKGEVIGVHLLAGHRISKLMLCRVTFCRYVRSGLHEVGAEFVEARPVFGGVPRIPTTWIEQAQRGAKAAAGLS